MQAFGIGTAGGGPYGRRLEYELHLQDNEGEPYVQLVVKDPLLVFKLPSEQVEALASQLAQAAKQLQRK
jgi:hypothetical protein